MERGDIALIIIFGLLYCTLIILIGIWLVRRFNERLGIAEEPETEESYLNSKVPKERGYQTVLFGGHTIQLSHEEWLVWNTWPRSRKRVFVRDFLKLKAKAR